MSPFSALAALAALLLLGSDAPPLPAPGTEGWEPLLLPNVERATRYIPVEVDGVRAVRAESRCSASALLLPTPEVDLAATPLLGWRWQVERGFSVPDERVQAGDDFAARVYVIFPFEPEHAGLLERARNALGRALYGDRVPGAALNYVWSTREPAGASWDNPFAASSKMISMGSGPLGSWRRAERDVRADFSRLFGREPPPVLGVALMSDSDNSCQEAHALFADFRFRALDAGDAR